jgi:hypothetical protein
MLSKESLAEGVLERVFARNPKGAHTLSNAVRDASDAVGAATKEARLEVARMLTDEFAELEACGTLMRDRRTQEVAWLLTPARMTERPPGSGLRTRADDYQLPPL